MQVLGKESRNYSDMIPCTIPTFPLCNHQFLPVTKSHGEDLKQPGRKWTNKQEGNLGSAESMLRAWMRLLARLVVGCCITIIEPLLPSSSVKCYSSPLLVGWSFGHFDIAKPLLNQCETIVKQSEHPHD